MIMSSNHIIQCQRIGITFDNLDTAMGVQHRVAEIFYEKLQPKMEALFDELAGSDYLYRIDVLEIDCGILAAKNWEEEWVESVLRQLRQELTLARSALTEREKTSDPPAATFFYFLRHGALPWNNRIRALREMEETLVLDAAFMASLRELVQKEWAVAERLTHQISSGFCNRLIGQMASGQGVLAELPMEGSAAREVRALLIRALAMGAPEQNSRLLHTLRLGHGNTKAIRKLLEREIAAKGVVKKDIQTGGPPEEAIYIDNAGLVLLHPFLPALLKEVRLLDNGRWAAAHAPYSVLYILEFLVTGREGALDNMPEFNLSLNKILCGMDPSAVIPPPEKLSEEAAVECEKLLGEVITHWSILKNTGIGSLRESFLQRSGRLTRTTNGWLLQVEQKGVDILLNSLPWGIGIVKLEWMQEVLYVEWT